MSYYRHFLGGESTNNKGGASQVCKEFMKDDPMFFSGVQIGIGIRQRKEKDQQLQKDTW